ncbi:MAG: hypothetical protein P8O16_10245 [Algoriphagus sp.]|uniref:hypothetical protein n=1 Tax=Algoriphagus sp. TaxID=1872435 RepID=UPI002619147C|nr:hypothetical protein [Algoriphagus sp.]MDG1277651.1 hypothetical protein [Algoriphagus sp.]
MKTKLILTVLITAFLLGFSTQTFAQEMSKENYLEKSRKQKTTAWILLGGGVAMAVTGAILFDENFILFGASDAEENKAGIGGAMFVVGGLAALGSVPLFISSSSNAKKTAKISFKNQPLNNLRYAGNIPKSIPSVHISIPLN